MINELRVILKDLTEFAKTATGFVLIGALATVWLALGVLVTYAVLKNPEQGLSYFKSVLSLKGSGISDSVRLPLMIVNYLTLIGLGVWFLIGPVKDYLNSIGARARSFNMRPSNGDDHFGGYRDIANG